VSHRREGGVALVRRSAKVGPSRRLSLIACLHLFQQAQKNAVPHRLRALRHKAVWRTHHLRVRADVDARDASSGFHHALEHSRDVVV